MSTESDMVAFYIQAEKDILEGKSISINGRAMTRENLQEVRAGRKEWEQRLSNKTASTSGGSSLYSLANFT